MSAASTTERMQAVAAAENAKATKPSLSEAEAKAAADLQVRAALKKAQLSEGSELTAEQRARALTPPARMTGKRLADYILNGAGDPAAKVAKVDGETKPAAKAGGEKPAAKAGGEKPAATEPQERDSEPAFDLTKSGLNGKPSYAAYAVLENGDLRPIGIFPGQDRTTMAKLARAALAKLPGMNAEKAANSEIISARPTNLRRTPRLAR